MDFLQELCKMPLSALVSIAKGIDRNASLAQSRDALIATIINGEPLPPDPMQIVRRRVHRLIDANYNQLAGLMDPECEECFKQGQQRCLDMRAVVDYLHNLQLIHFEE